MKVEAKRAFMIVSESVHNADMYYVTKFLAPDPFVYVRYKDKGVMVVSELEYGRAKKEAKVDEIRSSSEFGYNIKLEELVLRFLKELGIEEVEVPRYFPLYIAEELRKGGIEVFIAKEGLKQREIKSEEEIGYIKKAQEACEKAMEAAITVIKKSYIEDYFLKMDGEILTSEKLKAIIEHTLIDLGCSSEGNEPIVACGRDASDPHFTGSGPIYANEPIILDISPRLKKERYYADMTRTVVRGEPPREIKEMYEVVKEAQKAAIAVVKEGITCKEVHNLVCDIFEERGYKTLREGARKGFIHSTGHGIGLELHEKPVVSDNEDVLQAGNVITIEPGLYDPDVGGVRLEDVVVVLKRGCENITKFEKTLSL
ncbi:MAG: M24 family metallopeptidase [Candidatus Methanospirareceae archaeon]